MRRFCGKCTLVMAAVIFLGRIAAVQAALQPGQVAVLANSRFAGSVELAKYYCRARNVPTSHIITLAMPDGELLARLVYEKSVAVQVRAKLAQMPDGQRIRCLVTVRGVPLRIGSAIPSSNQKQLLNDLRTQTRRALEELEVLLERARKAAGLTDSSVGPTNNESLENRTKRLLALGAKEMPRAWTKVQSLPESRFRQSLSQKLAQVEGELLGQAGRINQLRRLGPMKQDDPRAEQLGSLQNQLKQAKVQISRLTRPGATAAQLQQAGKLARQSHGLLGQIRQLSLAMVAVNFPYKDSSSSFDSELSMVLAGKYLPGGPVPNGLSLKFRQSGKNRRRVLMVSRIDAPSDRLARGLVDKAIRAERTGLKGRAYIDTGWTKAKNKGYKLTEQSLLATDKMLRDYSGMTVRLDTRPMVFGPGSCPQAALYCGWYSLNKYVDAFDWVEGAVGYHIASFELNSLRNPKYTGWASSMVRDGITATLGAVEEPFLAAFPPPEEFFTLLLTGKFSLVECYYLTKRFNSWRLALIGDPLYRPFASNPRISIKQAEKILKQKLPGQNGQATPGVNILLPAPKQ